MSAAQRAAGSQGWALVVMRWAWVVVAWVSSWTARRALPVAAALGVGQDGGGFVGGVGGEGESGFGGQGAEDCGELGGGVAGEVDDGGEPGSERGGGVQHVTERAGLAGQDDGEFVAVVLPGFGQDLVQAAEDVLAVAGQVVPGVRASDHHQVAGDLDRLGHLRGGVPGSRSGRSMAGISIRFP